VVGEGRQALPIDEKASERAKAACKAASEKLAAMKTTKDQQHLSVLWSEFLIYTQRTFTRLRKATERGSSKGWSDNVLDVRSNDELLSYILHARNADEHGIEPITHRQASGFTLHPKEEKPWGAASTMREMSRRAEDHIASLGMELEIRSAPQPGEVLSEPSGRIITRLAAEVRFYPERVRLVPVRDRGRVYQPPSNHLGTPINDASPIGIATLAVAYLEAIISEAEKFR
jgi:hypothetical protein